jgi:hypothetical protein
MDSTKTGREAHDRHDVSKDEKGNSRLKWHMHHMKNFVGALIPKGIAGARQKKGLR